jgi:hypothetical protein
MIFALCVTQNENQTPTHRPYFLLYPPRANPGAKIAITMIARALFLFPDSVLPLMVEACEYETQEE